MAVITIIWQFYIMLTHVNPQLRKNIIAGETYKTQLLANPNEKGNLIFHGIF